MSDPVVQQLKQAIAAHGNALPQNRGELEQALAAAATSFPGKVKALLLLLDKNAVAFLQNWAKETRPDKGSYQQLRQQIATKFEQAKLINAAGAAWALDAWAYALGLHEEPAAAVGPAPASASGLSLQEIPHRPEPAPAAASAAPAAAPRPAVVTNPYAPPTASVEEPASEAQEGSFVVEGRKVDAGRGWSWLADAWELFKLSPGIWIVNFILFFVILVGLQLIPFIGWIPGALLQPVLTAGLMLGARAQHQGEDLEVAHLFAGFKENTGALVVVGVLYLVGSLIIVAAAMAIVGVGMVGLLKGGGGAAASGALVGVGFGVLLGVLVAMLLWIPLLMAYWFAPALVAINGLGAIDAMKASFSGCLKNMWPFLIYGIAGMVLMIVACIPIFLGLLIVIPLFLASMYTGYRDIYYDE